jgi:hypothetical protein
MFCHHCKKYFEQTEETCPHCGAPKPPPARVEHYIPIAVSVFAYVVFFLILDTIYEESHVFIFMTILAASFSVGLSFSVIPPERKTLRYVSVAVGGAVIGWTVIYYIFMQALFRFVEFLFIVS